MLTKTIASQVSAFKAALQEHTKHIEERNKRVSKYGQGSDTVASTSQAFADNSKYALFARNGPPAPPVFVPPAGSLPPGVAPHVGGIPPPAIGQAQAEKHLTILRNRKATSAASSGPSENVVISAREKEKEKERAHWDDNSDSHDRDRRKGSTGDHDNVDNSHNENVVEIPSSSASSSSSTQLHRRGGSAAAPQPNPVAMPPLPNGIAPPNPYSLQSIRMKPKSDYRLRQAEQAEQSIRQVRNLLRGRPHGLNSLSSFFYRWGNCLLKWLH